MEDLKNKHLSKGKTGKRGYWAKGHYISQSNTGHWSKYGGGRLVEIIDLPTWNCQSCHELQINCFPSYLFQYPEGEYIKICVMCRYIVTRFTPTTFDELITLVRRTPLFSLIANLLTLPASY
jgi:YgiT-type zinc finger domain-containing protein